MRHSYGKSRSRTNEFDLVAYNPATFVPQQTMGVVICHAASHLTSTFLSPNNGRPQAWALLQAISKVYPTVVADLAGDAFANDNAIAAVGQAVTFLQGASSPARAKPGKVLLVGTSMGFGTAAAWARANIASVAAIAGMVPMTKLTDLWTNNPGGTATASINTAYGGTYDPVAMGPTHDAYSFASSLTVPIKLWYGSADTTVLPSMVTDFAAAAPNVSLVSLPGLGHDTEGVYPLALANGLMEFLAANAA